MSLTLGVLLPLRSQAAMSLGGFQVPANLCIYVDNAANDSNDLFLWLRRATSIRLRKYQIQEDNKRSILHPPVDVLTVPIHTNSRIHFGTCVHEG